VLVEPRIETENAPTPPDSVLDSEGGCENERHGETRLQEKEVIDDNCGEKCEAVNQIQEGFDMASPDAENASETGTRHVNDDEASAIIEVTSQDQRQIQGDVTSCEITEQRRKSLPLHSDESLDCPLPEEQSTPDDEGEMTEDDQSFQSADEYSQIAEGEAWGGNDSSGRKQCHPTGCDKDRTTEITAIVDADAKKHGNRSMGELISLYTVETLSRYCKHLSDWDGNEAGSSHEFENRRPDEQHRSNENATQDGTATLASEASLAKHHEESDGIGMISEIDVESEKVEIRYIGEPRSLLATVPSVATMDSPLVTAPTATTMDTPITTAYTSYTMDTPVASAPTMHAIDNFDRDVLSHHGRFNGHDVHGISKDFYRQKDHYETHGRPLDPYSVKAAATEFHERSMPYPEKNGKEAKRDPYHVLIVHGIMNGFMRCVAILVAWFKHLARLTPTKSLNVQASIQCPPISSHWKIGDDATFRGEAIQVRGQRNLRMPSRIHPHEAGTSVEFIVPNVHVATDSQGRLQRWSVCAERSAPKDKPTTWSKAFSKIHRVIRK
jgi:hypothetical protein